MNICKDGWQKIFQKTNRPYGGPTLNWPDRQVVLEISVAMPKTS